MFYHSSHSISSFHDSYFGDKASPYAWAGLDHILLFVLPHIAGVMGPGLEMGSRELFALTGLESPSTLSLPPK
jgi:hypothetical protein